MPKHALRRSIGYVIQNVGLLPHLTVSENIGIIAKISGYALPDTRIQELVSQMGLDSDLLTKYPDQLSGGQQQRVGIARALSTDPDLILLDEPFSALDNVTRNQLQDDFLHLSSLKEKTLIMVTHDVQEAFKVGDRIAMLNKGKLQQIDTPQNLLTNPANAFVSSFLKNDRLILFLRTVEVEGKTLLDHLSDTNLNRNEKHNLLVQAMSRFQP